MTLSVLDLFSGRHGWSSRFREQGHKVVSVDNDPTFPDTTITGDVLSPSALARILSLGPYDIVLASPPCEAFSVAALSKNWWVVEACRVCGEDVLLVKRQNPNNHIWQHRDLTVDSHEPHAVISSTPRIEPRHPRAELGRRLVRRTLDIIAMTQPSAFVIENPTAMMRRLPELAHLTLKPTTYCKHGESRRKPTDLWVGGAFEDVPVPGPCLTLPSKHHPLAGKKVTMPDSRIFVTDREGTPCHEAAPRGARTGTQGMKDAAARAVIPYGLSKLFCDHAEKTVQPRKEVEP